MTPKNAMKHWSGQAAATAFGAAALVVVSGCVQGGTPAGPNAMALSDSGAFFVNGQNIVTQFPTPGANVEAGHITINQMYVQYRVPAHRNRHAYALAMIPAGFHTGMEYEATPDGRPGWAPYFLRQNFAVYVADQAGRARSGFDPTKFNMAKAKADTAANPGMPFITEERVWAQFRLGPSYGAYYPGSQFPVEARDQYFAAMVPMTDVATNNDTPKGIAALADKVGPIAVVAHSQSGGFALAAAEMRPEQIKALVLVEPSSCAITPAKMASVWAHVPVLTIWGDHIDADPARAKQQQACQALTDAINAAGGKATLIALPQRGIHGNGHIMTVEKNNLEIAALARDWLDGLPQ